MDTDYYLLSTCPIPSTEAASSQMESSSSHIVSKVTLSDLHGFGIDLTGTTENEIMRHTYTEKQGLSEPRALLDMCQPSRNSAQACVS